MSSFLVELLNHLFRAECPRPLPKDTRPLTRRSLLRRGYAVEDPPGKFTLTAEGDRVAILFAVGPESYAEHFADKYGWPKEKLDA